MSIIREDPLRWETPDGESPSRFGCFGAVLFLLAVYAIVTYFLLR